MVYRVACVVLHTCVRAVMGKCGESCCLCCVAHVCACSDEQMWCVMLRVSCCVCVCVLFLSSMLATNLNKSGPGPLLGSH